MNRSKFVAARSSRHRVAALALYRALIRTAGRVSIPQHLQAPGQRGSLVQLVRKRFAKNISYTSYRLIYASMAVGYKFLSLLKKAQHADSPEHVQVIDQLEGLRLTLQASRAAHPRPPPRRPPPTLPVEPLLINVAKAGEAPKYTSNILPRPASALTGPRRVPLVAATADGQPFLRMRKPQPQAMSRMVGRKGRIFSNRILNIMEVDEQWVPQAALEDEWDSLMEKLGREEAGRSEADEGGPSEADNPEATFGWSAQLSRLWFEYKIETMWEDWIARGDALQELAQKEQALFDQETGRQLGPLMKRIRGRDDLDQHLPPPNVGKAQHFYLPVTSGLRALRADPPTNDPRNMADPYLSDVWATLVRQGHSRMLSWMKKGASGLQADLPWKTARREKTQGAVSKNEGRQGRHNRHKCSDPSI